MNPTNTRQPLLNIMIQGNYRIRREGPRKNEKKAGFYRFHQKDDLSCAFYDFNPCYADYDGIFALDE